MLPNTPGYCTGRLSPSRIHDPRHHVCDGLRVETGYRGRSENDTIGGDVP